MTSSISAVPGWMIEADQINPIWESFRLQKDGSYRLVSINQRVTIRMETNKAIATANGKRAIFVANESRNPYQTHWKLDSFMDA